MARRSSAAVTAVFAQDRLSEETDRVYPGPLARKTGRFTIARLPMGPKLPSAPTAPVRPHASRPGMRSTLPAPATAGLSRGETVGSVSWV